MRFRWIWIAPVLVMAGCANPEPPEEPLTAAVTKRTHSAISGGSVTGAQVVTPDKPPVIRETKGKHTMSENSTTAAEPVMKTEEEWKKSLTPEQYHILREKGTERAFTGKYWHNEEKGTYACAGCGQDLFKSDTKYESGSGWPSFWEAIDKSKIKVHEDNSYGMRRIEVMCSRCGGHLGHVFDDGPAPTGQRYCINSASLNFKKQ